MPGAKVFTMDPVASMVASASGLATRLVTGTCTSSRTQNDVGHDGPQPPSPQTLKIENFFILGLFQAKKSQEESQKPAMVFGGIFWARNFL
jgi:hypothetical protein